MKKPDIKFKNVPKELFVPLKQRWDKAQKLKQELDQLMNECGPFLSVISTINNMPDNKSFVIKSMENGTIVLTPLN